MTNKKINKKISKKNLRLYLQFLLQIILIIVPFFGTSLCFAQNTAAERLDVLVGRTPTASQTLANEGTVITTTSTPVEPTGTPAAGGPVTTANMDERPPTLREQAFKELLNTISPLTPGQIVDMRKQQDRTQRAVATLPDTPPRPVSSTLSIDLSPGANPPVIRIGAGYISSLVFLDSTGQSWPIADYSLGNPKYFNIQWDRKTNTIFMQGTTQYSTGNLAVRLATLDTPIMISLVTGQKEIDYRVDLHVPGRGPNALVAIIGDNLPSHPNPYLINVLDGIPPPGSVELEICGGYGRVWLYQGKLVFRTRETLLSPAWSTSVSSADGTRAYEIPITPLILVSHEGRTTKIEVKGL